MLHKRMWSLQPQWYAKMDRTHIIFWIITFPTCNWEGACHWSCPLRRWKLRSDCSSHPPIWATVTPLPSFRPQLVKVRHHHHWLKLAKLCAAAWVWMRGAIGRDVWHPVTWTPDKTGQAGRPWSCSNVPGAQGCPESVLWDLRVRRAPACSVRRGCICPLNLITQGRAKYAFLKLPSTENSE